MRFVRVTTVISIFAAALVLLARSPVLSQETNVNVVGAGVFETSYFDVATSQFQSAAGFGGGGSGGAGDNTVRISNATAQNGTLCAMIYVFDDSAQMQACCGCPVTPNGIRTLSVANNLTFNFGVAKGNVNAGTIYMISSTPNFAPGSSLALPAPLGTNGCLLDSLTDLPSMACLLTSPGCDPAGSSATDKRVKAINPTPGLHAWITHDELAQPGGIPNASSVQGTSVDDFQDSPLESAHVTALGNLCNELVSNGSGAGVCTCGTGENSVAPSTASR